MPTKDSKKPELKSASYYERLARIIAIKTNNGDTLSGSEWTVMQDGVHNKIKTVKRGQWLEMIDQRETGKKIPKGE